MNLVCVCPEIPDNWKGGITATAQVLGLSRDTIMKYAALGKRNGGIDWTISRVSGRKQFSGREVKRFWREYV